MERKRKVYAPFSQTSEAGVTQTPVEGYIDVNQTIYPTVNTGVVNEKGQWAGIKSDDDEFLIMGTNVAVPNGGQVLVPAGNPDNIDMSGFSDMFLAIKPTQSGSIAIQAIMGPDTNSFANLTPVNPGSNLKGADALDGSLENVLVDSAETCTANVWNIFIIKQRLAGQRMFQFKLVNNSGAESDIQFAFMRLV